MKNLALLLLFISITSITYAQDRQERRQERVKAAKIAFLTERLELTPEKAQVFWPIYNQFEEQRAALHKQERAIIDRSRDDHSITETDANQILDQFYAIKKKMLQIEQEQVSALKEVLTALELLELHHAEAEFRRELLRRLRQERGDRPNRRG